MPYKKKLILLGSLAALLAIIFILTIVFDPARTNARNERFTWLPAGARDEADRIEIFRGEERLEIVFKNGVWVVPFGSVDVPARQARVDDLFRLISTRGAFPRRGSNSRSHAELGLDGSTRLVIRGGGGLPLLDLLIGKDDSTGRAVFLCKRGEQEFRSGDRLISAYVNGEQNSWLNLKLFDEKSVAQVQRVLVHFKDYYGTGEEISPVPYEDYTITRGGDNWLLSAGGNGSFTEVEKTRTENWIRAILEAQGEDIIPLQQESMEEINNAFPAVALFRMELGDGSSLEFKTGDITEDGRCLTSVNGKPYLFIFSQLTSTRLLRNRDFFLHTP
ncbi:MAG: hypothetical protein FWG07_05480 [Treponema sp.]|nr:hypothetical protein [Treponema sp.]